MRESRGKDKGKPNSSLTIQSADRVLSILELICRSYEPMSVIEISQRLGISRTTTHGLVNSLLEANYIQKASIPGRYTMSPKIYSLSCTYPNRLPLVSLTDRHLRNLANKFNTTVHLGILYNNSTILLVKAHFPGNLNNPITAYDFPIHASAMGKMILANISEEKRERILDQVELTKYTSNTYCDRLSLNEELDRIREHGFALDRAEYLDNTFCISFPIFNNKNEIAAAFSLSNYHFEHDVKEILPDGLQCSKLCSRELGWKGP